MKDLLLTAYVVALTALKRLTRVERGAVKCITLLIVMTLVTVVHASTGYVAIYRAGVAGETDIWPPDYTKQPTGAVYTVCNYTSNNVNVAAWFVQGCGATPALGPLTLRYSSDPNAPNWCTGQFMAFDYGQNRPVLFAMCDAPQMPFVYCSGSQTAAACR